MKQATHRATKANRSFMAGTAALAIGVIVLVFLFLTFADKMQRSPSAAADEAQKDSLPELIETGTLSVDPLTGNVIVSEEDE